MKQVLTENFTAEAAIAPHRICKPGSADGTVVQAAAAANLAIGVSDSLGADAAGDRVDIHTIGVVEVELGGAVARGAQITADANGKGVTAAAGNRTAGISRVSGVAGDIVLMLLAPGTV